MQQNNLYTLDQVKADKDHDYVLADRCDGVPMYRRVVDVHEAYQAALEDWLGVLAQLWTAFGKPIDVEQMTIYQRNLSVLPLGLLDASVQRAIREHAYQSVPLIAEVWAAVRRELGNPVDIDRAIDTWCEVKWNAAVIRLGVSVETEGRDE